MIFETENELIIEQVLPEIGVNDDELLSFAKKQGLKEDIANNVNRWYVFCIKYMQDKGYDIITAKSFAEWITYLATDVRLNTVPEYYKGDKLYDDIVWGIIHERYMYSPKPSDFKDIFEDIELLYEENYDEYTYKTEQLLLKVSIPLRQKFQEIPGKSYSEKLHFLIDSYEEKIG